MTIAVFVVLLVVGVIDVLIVAVVVNIKSQIHDHNNEFG
jgi:hypothetical protein